MSVIYDKKESAKRQEASEIVHFLETEWSDQANMHNTAHSTCVRMKVRVGKMQAFRCIC